MNLNMNNIKIEVKSQFVVVVTALTLVMLLIRLICPVKFSWLYVLAPFAIHLAVILFQAILAHCAILIMLLKELIIKLQDRFQS